MVRHIIIWHFQDGFTTEENRAHAQQLKQRLEGLKGHIEGLLQMRVIIDPLATSNADVMLNSLFENEEALAAYQVHPEHKAVSVFVAQVMKDRRCIDYHE